LRIYFQKIKSKKGQQRYISRVRGGGTLGGVMVKRGTFVEPLDVMNHANSSLSDE
jgi:hypothetical protein